MAQQILSIGSAVGDGTGELLRSGMVKINANFSELYAAQAVNSRSGSGTLAITDANAIVEVDSATAATITVPLSANVAFPVGTVIEVMQVGVGAVSVAAAGGVILNGTLTASGQWRSLFLRKRGTDSWVAQ